eukprot:m.96924 g.96924  ORF g.96924 m.96924 type:complete len:193 (-) comp13086_c0_seq4:5723-6301(-)
MSSFENAPLTGAELFPKRVSNGTMYSFERILGYGSFVLAFTACIIGIVFGIKNHIEHLVAGCVVLVVAAQFGYVARQYQLDLNQDKKVVYISWGILVLISALVMMYAFTWQKPDPYHGCTGWFLPPSTIRPNGICLSTLPSNFTKQETCYSLSSTPTTALAQALPKAATTSCSEAHSWLADCGAGNMTWSCK